jgi:hypothetical protein
VLDTHLLKQILIDTRPIWDNPGFPSTVRENFIKIINCGTPALGAEVYASETERKLVYHTCKSRFCPSCGHRATELWQAEMEAALPDIPYVNLNLTMPRELWPIFQQNRSLLRDLPALGAAAIQHWVNARYGARVLLLVVQHTFGGFLNFYPHLHILVSAGGLQKSANLWIARLCFEKRELMQAWRYQLVAYLAELIRRNVLKAHLGTEGIKTLKAQYQRGWNIFVSRIMSKSQFLGYVGRYIRRPPIAQWRLERISDREVQYLAKNTKKGGLEPVRYSNEEFIEILKDHVPERFRHSMRYFGLLSPRSKHYTSPALFVLLRQTKRPRPPRLSWADSIWKYFGIDPLLDSHGQRLIWVGRLNPVTE